ncbi:MAG: hypothetical protein AVO38_15160 [delta proteobacterium ML8_D]|nr:MAG: hypothetical protein AVO34_07980 [Firmicutes bacterium ML8_F2]OPL12279.1 MAG: hypothetical protein AVO38_15160 [delta proteobacterium ML8_D]
MTHFYHVNSVIKPFSPALNPGVAWSKQISRNIFNGQKARRERGGNRPFIPLAHRRTALSALLTQQSMPE